MSTVETAILRGMISSEAYARQVVPHIDPEYFREPPNRTVYEICSKIFTKYGTLPTKTQLEIECAKLRGSVSDAMLRDVAKVVMSLEPVTDDVKWLVDTTEQFCKDAAFYIAASKVMAIMSGAEKNLTRESVPDIFKQALGVSFDNRIGHDYFDDAAARWDFYHDDVERVRFKIQQFNDITGGGLPVKSLSTPVAGTNVGKTAILCAFTADWISQGYDVLYVSGELSQERIAERVDANLLDMTIAEVHGTDKEYFLRRLEALRPGFGRLKVIEYPTKKASVQTVEKLLYDLELKKKFRPSVIAVDYLTSFRPVTCAVNAGMFEKGKCLAEEFRGLGVEFNVPVVAPAQTNRTGQNSSDFGFEEVGESHGISQTADFMFSIIRTEALRESRQLLMSVFKNRFGPVDYKFVVGFDFSKMKMYQCNDQSLAGAQTVTPEPAPVRTGLALKDSNGDMEFSFGSNR